MEEMEEGKDREGWRQIRILSILTLYPSGTSRRIRYLVRVLVCVGIGMAIILSHLDSTWTLDMVGYGLCGTG